VIADVDQALRHLAADPERKLALHPRLDLARQRDFRRVVGQLNRHDLHQGRQFLRRGGLAASGEDGQRNAAGQCKQPTRNE
jgi:hypothetical protein